MNVIPITAHLIQHNSEPTHFVYPYLFTHYEPKGIVYIWLSDDQSLYCTLEEPMADPKEHHLISDDYLLSLTTASGAPSWEFTELLIHHLPDGALKDRMRLGPVDSSGPGGNSKFLGISGENIAVWRNSGANGGNGVIEIYVLSQHGTLDLSATLVSPFGSSNLESIAIPGMYFPPTLLYLSPYEFIGVDATRKEFPRSIEVTRYTSTSHSSESRQKQIVFDFTSPTLPYPRADMRSSLYSETKPVTAVRCLDFDTLELKWQVALQYDVTCKLRYIPSMDVILSIGDGSTVLLTEGGILENVTSYLSLTVLHPSTGEIRALHTIGGPERPCGTVHWYDAGGVCCDLTSTREELGVIFGDGQLAVINVDRLLGSGFPKIAEDRSDKGTVITTVCPAIDPSIPSSKRDEKDLRAGRWRWVRRAFFGDKMVIVHLASGKGFAALLWK
ncbi:hypothetical protein CPB84DRAFT_1828140 [Gymnopilus junonius]|uniref:Uncharacterized protein n=1 Tax=Gymnopilus junonius TaxID=109634 RepID=A0A9P5NFQ4_GYMJU|nr:hypothetical protein CPB84DRAFT_1828140 [Gymnopilus junonius]